MADDQKHPQPHDGTTTQTGVRRAWKRPALTAYGPIGKLTQGSTGLKADGSAGKKNSCL